MSHSIPASNLYWITVRWDAFCGFSFGHRGVVTFPKRDRTGEAAFPAGKTSAKVLLNLVVFVESAIAQRAVAVMAMIRLSIARTSCTVGLRDIVGDRSDQ